MNFENNFRKKGDLQPTISEMRRRQVRDKLRDDAEAALRDLAFVFAMTERVKQQILNEVEEDSEADLVLA